MPTWMSPLHKKLTTSSTHINICLYIAKLIINQSKVTFHWFNTRMSYLCLLYWQEKPTIDPLSSLSLLWLSCPIRKYSSYFIIIFQYAFSFCFCLCHLSKLFEPYAKFWLTPLMELILRIEEAEQPGTEGINYFVVDLVVTLLSWNSTAIPEVR